MTHKRSALLVAMLAGGIALLLLGMRISSDLPHELPKHSGIVSAIGGLYLTAGLILFSNGKAHPWLETRLERFAVWLGVTNWQVILLTMGLVFSFAAAIGAGFWKRMYSPLAALIAWMLGMMLVFLGGSRKEDRTQTSAKAILAMILVTAFALLPRVMALDSIPYFFNGDEGSAGLGAMDFANGDWNNIFVTGWFSFPTLYSFIQSLSIRVFGQTIEAVRIPSALAGALTVTAVLLAGSAMFGKRTGIFSALLLAALHLHVHFSRLGLNNIWDGLWYTVTLGALWYGWEHNKRSAYLIAGLGLGLSQYFYASSHGLFFVIFVCGLFALWTQKPHLQKSLPDLLLLFLLAAVVIFPLARYYLHEPYQLLAPISRASYLNDYVHPPPNITTDPRWKVMLGQLSLAFQAFTHAPIKFYYSPETSILRPIYAVLFYIGLFFLAWKKRDSRFVLLLLWIITFGLIGGLSESVPAAQRYVASAPACALLAGFGLHKLGDVLGDFRPRYAKILSGLVYVVLAAAMISDLYFYFVEFRVMDQIDNTESHGTIAQRLAYRLEDEPPGTQVAFFALSNLGYYSIPSIQYLAPQVTGIDISGPWESFDKTLLDGDPIIFVFLPERKDEMRRVMREYPGGSVTEGRSWNDQVLFWAYEFHPARQ